MILFWFTHQLLFAINSLGKQERVNNDEVSDHDDVYDVRKIYWDSDGNLRHGKFKLS